MSGDNSTRIVLDADAQKLISEFSQATATLKAFSEQQKSAASEVKNSGKEIENTWLEISTGIRNGIEIWRAAKDQMVSVWGYARQAAEKAELSSVFNKYAASMAVSGDSMVESLKKSTRGLVGQADLIRGSMRAMQLGVSKDTETMGKIWEIAQAKAKLFGRGVADVFEEIVSAIGRGKTRSLVDLGFLPESFAKSKTGADLLLTRTQALSVVLKQGAKDVQMLSGEGDSAAEKFQRFDLAVAGLKKSFLGLAPDISTTVEGMTSVVNASKDGVKYLAGMTDEVKAMAAGYAAFKIGAYVESFYALAVSLKEAAKAQATFNIAVSANPYLILAAGAAGIAAWAKSIHGETKQIEEDTRRLLGQTDPITQIKSQIDAKKMELDHVSPVIRKVAGGEFEEDMVATQRKRDALDREIKTLQSQLDNLYELSKVRGVLEKATFVSGVAGGVAGGGRIDLIQPSGDQGKAGDIEKVGKTAKKATEKLFDFKKALEGAFESGQNKSFEAIAPTFEQIGEKAKESAAAFLQLGPGKLGIVRDFFEDAAQMAGVWAGNIEKASRDLDKIDINKLSEIATKAQSYAFGIAGVAGMIPVPGGVFKTASIKSSEIDYDFSGTSGVREADQLFEEYHDKLKINVSDAFEQGLYDGLNGGNFLESFGNALRSQLIRAFSASVTQRIFGLGGGVYDLGSGGWSSGAGVDSNTGANIVDSTSSGSGGGLLNNLTNQLFKPLYVKNAAGKSVFSSRNLFSNVGTGLVVGYAADRLFGAGGLFGSRIDHGAEAISQAGDINAQVNEAIKQRNDLYKSALGMSGDTYNQLRGMSFWSAGYSYNDSGDGIFSKKTRTYQLDAAAAQAALEKFNQLAEKAANESALRQIEISFKELDSPIDALRASLSDLQLAITRAPDELSKKTLELQAAQITKQIEATKAADLSNWTSFGVANPFAGYGDKSTLIYDAQTANLTGKTSSGLFGQPLLTGLQGTNLDESIWVTNMLDSLYGGKATFGESKMSAAEYVEWLKKNYPGDWQSIISQQNPSDVAKRFVGGSFFSNTGDYKDKFRVGDTEMSSDEFNNWAGTQVMIQGIKNQSGIQQQLAEQAANGTNAWDMVIKTGGPNPQEIKYVDAIKSQVSQLDEIMTDLENQMKQATLNQEQRNQLFQSWQEANNAYYALKNEQLTIEAQKEAELKAKASTLQNDILGTLLTHVGEISEKNGQQVIVLSAGQPDAKVLIDKLKGALAGTEPEVVKLLEDFSEAYLKANWS